MNTGVMRSKRLTALIICLSALMFANAQKVTIDGLNYYLNADNHEAIVDNGNSWSGELVIPSELSHNGEKYVVKSLCWAAFFNCHELTKVKIPKTVEEIDNRSYSDNGTPGAVSPDYKNPFIGCTALEAIEVDEGNLSMCAVDGVLFSKDRTKLYCYPAGAKNKFYAVPDDVAWIGGSAFSSNSSLVKVVIPNSVTHLSSGAFSGCKSLKSVSLSESIRHIAAYTFDNCESLEFLEIPESVSSFEESVFRWSPIKTLVIRGIFPQGFRYDTFYFMDAEVVIYVQDTEVEKLKAELAKIKDFSGKVLPLSSYVAYGQDENSDGFLWIYGFSNNWQVEDDAVICKNVTYWTYTLSSQTINLNGKVYHPVVSEPANAITRGGKDDSDERWYAVGIRKEGGRVYVNYEDYIAYLSRPYNGVNTNPSFGNPSYVPYPVTNEGELILYDYTMEIGDKFQSIEGYNDVSVVAKDIVVYEDKNERRRLTLSNGLVLIEGIGCINSNGHLLDYLNPSPLYEGYFSYLKQVLNANYNSIYETDVKVIDDTELGVNVVRKYNIPSFYDLQGRQLQSNPRKGLYIRDGKKYLVK